MNDLLLMLHLIGAGVVGILIFITFLNLIKAKVFDYQEKAINIAIASMFQLITGSLLSLTSSSSSLLAFCSKIGFYLGLVFMTEVILYLKIRKFESYAFPFVPVFSSISTGLVFVFITVIAHF